MFGKFGNMFGDMKEKQDALRQELQETKIEVSSPGQEIKVIVNGVREVVDIQINDSFIEQLDKDALEDLLTITLNEALAKAAEKEASETEKLIKDMMPPGLGGLKRLFG